MHEISIIHDTLDIAIENGKINNLSKIEKIYMKIGDFTCVDENALNFAFESLRQNTICEEAILIVEKVKGKAICQHCNEKFEIDFTDKICPICNNYSNNICNGYEILVWQIEGD